MVSGQLLQYSNDCLRFVADGNDQILKLLLLSNELSLIGKNYHTLATLLLPLINGGTVYYWSHTIKPTPFIWIVIPGFHYSYKLWIHYIFLLKFWKAANASHSHPRLIFVSKIGAYLLSEWSPSTKLHSNYWPLV